MADEAPSTTAGALEGTERDAALEAWTAVLDDLEADLDAVAGEAALGPATETAINGAADEHPPNLQAEANWTPPHLDTPLPDALLARARRIRDCQVAVLSRLAADAETLRRHRSALGSVRAATAPRLSAVYLDVTG